MNRKASIFSVHIRRNLYFGSPEIFERYNPSKSRESIECKGQTPDFPDLGDRVADKLYSGLKLENRREEYFQLAQFYHCRPKTPHATAYVRKAISWSL